MSTAGILISFIGGLLGGLVIVLPLIFREDVAPTEDTLIQAQREYLLVYYEQVLRTMRDLDEDYDTGKLAEAMYLESREQWIQSGTQILQALDELPTPQVNTATKLGTNEINQRIEAEIQRYLTAKAGNL